MRSARNLFLILIGLVAGLALLELGIRSYDAARGYSFFSERRNKLASIPRIRPFRTFGQELYRDHGSERQIMSRHGEVYPFEKPEGTIRIVAFGGSTTENINAVRRAGIHYPAVLQKRLRDALGRSNIEVINVAYSAYSTAHSLILLALDVVSWNPDVILVSHNINDLTAAYWPNFTPDYSNKYSHFFYNIPDTEHIYSLINVLFQKSQLYWVIRDRLDRILRHRSATYRRVHYGQKPPAEALDIFKRNLRSIVAIAERNGIDVVLGTQALIEKPELFEIAVSEDVYNDVIVYPYHEEFISHHNAFNDAILQITSDLDVYSIDNRLNMSGNESYFIDFVHYTPDGVRRLAENYASLLLTVLP